MLPQGHPIGTPDEDGPGGDSSKVDTLTGVTSELSSLERDIEETRVRLASTIDQLTYRASPKTIINREITSIKAFFIAQDGAPRTDNILKVVGGVVGVVAVFITLRKITN